MFARVRYFEGMDLVRFICFLFFQIGFIIVPCMADDSDPEKKTFLTHYNTNLVQQAKLCLAYEEVQNTAPRYPNMVTNWIPSFTATVWGVKPDCVSDSGREYGVEWTKTYVKTFKADNVVVSNVVVSIVALDSAVKAHEYLVYNACAPSYGKPSRRCEVMSESNKIGFRCFQYSMGDQFYYVEFIRNNIWIKIEGTRISVNFLALDFDRQILELSR